MREADASRLPKLSSPSRVAQGEIDASLEADRAGAAAEAAAQLECRIEGVGVVVVGQRHGQAEHRLGEAVGAGRGGCGRAGQGGGGDDGAGGEAAAVTATGAEHGRHPTAGSPRLRIARRQAT
jgi:hypothetical protein